MTQVANEGIRLTELVSCGGCAAKYSAARLQELVSALGVAVEPALLVGLAPSDDAAVYRLDDDRAIVFTLDFFPPIVDDPADFGAIAATNALNDIFAMGGRPLVALSIAAFPESLPTAVLGTIFEAAASKVAEAGGVLAGGHTLRDEEPKYGLAVVGSVAPNRFWTKAGAQPGDALYLTKRLGTGLIMHARKQGMIELEDLDEAIESMKTLNRRAAELLAEVEPHAVTDVTGFGLIGHAYEVAERSHVRIVLESALLPAMSGARELAAAGIRTGGDRRNREYVGDALRIEEVGNEDVALAFDPQTAGGLLVAIPAAGGSKLERLFHESELFLTRVGRVEEGVGVDLV